MAFNVATISAEIAAAGVLKTNHYDVFFSPPRGLIGYTPGAGASSPVANFDTLQDIHSLVHLYAEQANIPGVMIGVAPIRRYGYGPMENKPFAPLFNDAQMVFRCDSNATMWMYLQAWARLVINYENNKTTSARTGIGANQHPYELSYKDDYATDISVRNYNEQGDKVLTTVLRGAYPMAVGDIPLSWETSKTYVKVPVTFTYMDWYQETNTPLQSTA